MISDRKPVWSFRIRTIRSLAQMWYEEDVGFGPENIGVPTEEIWKRVEKSLKAVGMWQYREHSPNKLIRRTEAACGDRRSDGDAAKVHRTGRADSYAGSEWTERKLFGGCAGAQP